MTEFIIARHRVAIAGVVSDGLSGKPIAGAHLEITAKPAAYAKRLALLEADRSPAAKGVHGYDTVRTRTNGLFFFMDLPEGEYKLIGFVPKDARSGSANAQLPAAIRDAFQGQADTRYGEMRFDAVVSYAPEGFGKLAVLRLQPTGITGRVVASATKSAVLMAEVRIKGSGERTFTDAQGQFTIPGLRPNDKQPRIVQFRARGYRDQSLEVLVDKPGVCKRIADLELAREGG